MSTPPAGWYPDPGDATKSRYWDGLAWTGHVAAAAPVLSPKEQRRAAILAARWPPIVAGWLGVACLVAWMVPVLGVLVGALATGCGAGVVINVFQGGRGVLRGVFAVIAGFATLMVSAHGLGAALN